MVVLLIIGIVITILIRHKNKKRFREQERIHNIKQAALLNRLKNSNEKLRKLKDEEKQKHYNNSQTTEIHTTSFYEEPICVIIKEKVKQGQFLSNVDYSYYKDYALEKKQIIDLRKAVDFHFNNFTFRISKAYPKLTQNDIDYCCLYLLNLQDADIAALMQRAYNTINERNHKLKKIFGGNNPIQNTVYEIANEFN